MTTPTRRVVDIERLRALEALAQLAIVARDGFIEDQRPTLEWVYLIARWHSAIIDRGEPIITPDLGAGE